MTDKQHHPFMCGKCGLHYNHPIHTNSTAFMTTTNWSDSFYEAEFRGEMTSGTESAVMAFIEKTLSSAHQQWVDEVVGRFQELKDGCRLGITEENDKNPDCQYCTALDAAISVVKKGE